MNCPAQRRVRQKPGDRSFAAAHSARRSDPRFRVCYFHRGIGPDRCDATLGPLRPTGRAVNRIVRPDADRRSNSGGDSRREGGEPARDRTRTVRRDSSQLFEIGIPQDRRPSSGRTRFVACWRTPFEALRSPLLGRPSVASEKGRTAGPQAVDDGRLDVDEATGCLGAARATGARPWATSSGWRHRRRA